MNTPQYAHLVAELMDRTGHNNELCVEALIATGMPDLSVDRADQYLATGAWMWEASVQWNRAELRAKVNEINLLIPGLEFAFVYKILQNCNARVDRAIRVITTGS